MESKVTFEGPPGILRNKYEAHISSPEWAERRKQRLEHDGRCRTCGHTEDLQVHHVSYENFGNEPLDDLITLCGDCHDAITNVLRGRRHKCREIHIGTIDPLNVPGVTRGDKDERDNHKNSGSAALVATQRVVSRSIK